MNDITINIHIQIYVLSYSFLSLRLRPKSRIQHFILKFFKSIGKVEEWYITYPLLQFSVGNSMPYLLYLSVSIKYFFMRHLVESCRHHDLLALNTSLPNNKAILLHNHNTITTKKTFFPTLFWIFQNYRKVESVIHSGDLWPPPFLILPLWLFFLKSHCHGSWKVCVRSFLVSSQPWIIPGCHTCKNSIVYSRSFQGWFHKTPCVSSVLSWRVLQNSQNFPSPSSGLGSNVSFSIPPTLPHTVKKFNSFPPFSSIPQPHLLCYIFSQSICHLLT